MFEIKREVKALVRALEQKRFKAGRRSAKKTGQKESPQKQDPDLRVEAKELRRAHRAVSSETKSLGGFWHTPSPCRQREFVCPAAKLSTFLGAASNPSVATCGAVVP
eukprot:s1135_g12.t1